MDLKEFRRRREIAEQLAFPPETNYRMNYKELIDYGELVRGNVEVGDLYLVAGMGGSLIPTIVTKVDDDKFFYSNLNGYSGNNFFNIVEDGVIIKTRENGGLELVVGKEILAAIEKLMARVSNTQ